MLEYKHTQILQIMDHADRCPVGLKLMGGFIVSAEANTRDAIFVGVRCYVVLVTEVDHFCGFVQDEVVGKCERSYDSPRPRPSPLIF